MASSVWLDCDPGFDDWMAWLLLEAHAATQSKFQVHGISLTHGNTRLDQVSANAQAIASLMGFSTPLWVGAAQALQGPGESAERVLGPQGMRTTGPALDTTAPAQLVSLSAILPGLAPPDCIIALGPLTNLAQRLLSQWGPQIPVIWMGGSTDRGNHTAAAEFNALADPEAAAQVFASTQQMRMVGLNVCREVLLDRADVERFETLSSKQARVFTGHLAAYQRIRSADGARPMPLYDPVAVAAALHPEWFEFTSARVDVECAGEFTRGMTVCEFRLNATRSANALVATGLQAHVVKRWILDTTYTYLQRFEACHHD